MEYRYSRAEDHRETRRGRGACIFPYFSAASQQTHEIEIPLIIPLLEELTREPITLGDHLRRRRIELELYQKDVAANLGVTTSTVWNWENRGSVGLRFIPRIVEFLGYNPIPKPEDLLKRLAWYKLVNGLSLERLGAEMGRDPEQLAGWLSGSHYPCWRNRDKIEMFLSSHTHGPDAIQRPENTFPEDKAATGDSMNPIRS